MKKIRFKDYLKDYLEFNNISNKDFALRIGITPKHLIDILSGDCDMSAQVIEAISIVTEIPMDYICKIEVNYKLETDIENYLQKNNYTISQYLNKFSYKYLATNKWIRFTDKEDKLEIAKDILKFLRVKSPEKVYEIDKNIFFKSKNDKPELKLLWLEKCYKEFLGQSIQAYKKENIDVLVKYIHSMAKENIFNEEQLIKIFNENGIGLVIEDDIPGSKIRGAFKVHKNTPVIYITHKHNRIADIYFALLHELAHCKKDFNKAKSTNIISYTDDSYNEVAADNQAFEWMVKKEYYNLIGNEKYNIEEESEYPKAFIVYRLAHDKKITYSSKEYQKYNTLIC